MNMTLLPLWSDSLGAKSFSFYLECSKNKIIIDPGIAVMQPSYPMEKKLLIKWYEEGYEKIREYLLKSDIVIITHYHHDHYLSDRQDIKLYRNKRLLVKDPNRYINDSQWNRAREFLQLYIEKIIEENIREYMVEPQETDYHDYVEDYTIALSKDFGTYSSRRRELLEKGRKWFLKRTSRWSEEAWIREVKSSENIVEYADGRIFYLDNVKITFSDPFYHGIEYSKTGWVTALVIESKQDKILYSSDIQGPIIEDYAAWIIDNNPEILLLDGPPTYLIPYMFNLINFRRTQENIKWIIEEADNLKLIIYDHHLTRDIRFREKIREVYKYADRYDVKILNVAEYLNLKPAYEKI